MKKLFISLAALLIAALCQAQKEQWQPYPVIEGVTVEFPAKPEIEAVPVDSPDVTESKGWSSVSDVGQFVVLSSKVKDGDKVPDEDFLDTAVEGFTEGSYQRLIAEKELLVNGWPEVEVTVQRKNGIVFVARFLKIHSHLIQLIGNYPGAVARPRELDRFFDSLLIGTPVGAGPLKHAGPDFKAYPLGSSGISLLFPHEPQPDDSVKPDPSGAPGIVRYKTAYASRSYIAGYGDLPAEVQLTAEKASIARANVCDDIAKWLDGDIAQKRELPLGTDDATWCEIPLKKDQAGLVAIVVTVSHGHRLVSAVAIVPYAWAKSTEVVDFIHSIKFAS